ncbi:MAG: PQQ-binding-like beta-propeller repeat protein, partial [Candidatus Eremiobacterota bacterium]
PDGGFYASQVSSLECYDASGRLAWSRPLADDLDTATASGPEGNCYVAAHSTLFAVDSSGKTRWTKPLQKSWHEHPPVVGPDGTVYFATHDGTVYAFDQEGEEMWHYQVPVSGNGFCPIKTKLSVGKDGTVAFGAGDELYLIREGRKLWGARLGHGLESYDTPAVGEGLIYASGGDRRDTVIAFDAATGEEKWRKTVGSVLHLTANPVGGVVVGLRGGPLFGLAVDGRHAWTYQDGNTFSQPIPGPDGRWFTSTSGRYVKCFAPPVPLTEEERLQQAAEQLARPREENPQVVDLGGYLLVGGVPLRKRGAPGG